jgi:serine/threonine-protein kinase Chk1
LQAVASQSASLPVLPASSTNWTSRVYLARKDDDGTIAAVKVVCRQDDASDKRVLKEIRIHSTLRSPHVLAMLGYEMDDAGSPGRPEWGAGPAFYLALEYASGGDLFDKIAPDVGVPEDIAHCFFSQLLNALRYCHEKGICHRDIKPEKCVRSPLLGPSHRPTHSLLVDAHASVKLCDFGLSAVYRLKGQERPLAEPCGSLPYAAPELALGKPYRAEPIDVWSTGVVLFTLLVGSASRC